VDSWFKGKRTEKLQVGVVPAFDSNNTLVSQIVITDENQNKFRNWDFISNNFMDKYKYDPSALPARPPMENRKSSKKEMKKKKSKSVKKDKKEEKEEEAVKEEKEKEKEREKEKEKEKEEAELPEPLKSSTNGEELSLENNEVVKKKKEKKEKRKSSKK
tara:strand:- start:1375 stop:1851 length:477 start_codon:yes stop_codon:yes gene_type:complete